MILAAGLGTRLKPWTDSHPKALVPVKGVPMLERVIVNLKSQGFERITVNVHHFAEQVLKFLRERDFGVSISISDESGQLLDTGGAILRARHLLDLESGPVLIHNVDILSDADLGALMRSHEASGADSTLLVSDRESSRKLIFDHEEMTLEGWHNEKLDIYKPAGFIPTAGDREYAFSGIHVVGKDLVEDMARLEQEEKFSIMDFLLRPENTCDIRGYLKRGLRLIDIGKPETLERANIEWR